MTAASLFIKISADWREARTAFQSVADDMGAMVEKTERKFSKIASLAEGFVSAGTALTAGVTVPLVGIGVAAVKVSEDLNMARLAFTTMLGSAEKANTFLKELQAFAASTPFEFPDLVDASKRMMAMGFAAKDVVPNMRAIGDAAAALGGGKQFIDGVTTALGQMQAKGKVSAEEMNQLAERGVPAWQMLADKIGTGIPEAMKLAEKGAISASVAIPAILEGMNEKFGGQMSKASQTLTGVWSNFTDQTTLILGQIGNKLAPVLLTIVQAALPLLEWVKSAVEWFGQLPQPVQAFALTLAALAAALGPVLLAAGGLATAITALMPALTAIGTFFGVSVVALGGWAVAIAAVLAGLVALGVWVHSNWEPIVAVVKQAWDGIVEIAQAVWGAYVSYLTGIWNGLVSLITNPFNAIKSYLETVWDGVFTVAKLIWDGYKLYLETLWGGLKMIAETAFNAVTGFLDTVWDGAGTAMRTAWDGIKEYLGSTWDSLMGIAQPAFDGVASFLSGIWDSLVGVWKAAWDGIFSALSGVWESLKGVASSIWEPVAKFFLGIWDSVSGVWKSAWEGIKSNIGGVWNAIKEMAETVWGKITAALKTFMEWAAKIPGVNKLMNLDEAWNSAKKLEDQTKNTTSAVKDHTTKANDLKTAHAALAPTIAATTAEKVKAHTETTKYSAGVQILLEKLRLQKTEFESNVKWLALYQYELGKGNDLITNKLYATLDGLRDRMDGNARLLHDASSMKLPAWTSALGTANAAIPPFTGNIGKVQTAVTDLNTKGTQEMTAFRNSMSKLAGDLSEDITNKLFRGQGSWVDIGKTALNGLANAFRDQFIQPATDAVMNFISGALADLLGGKGLGGILTSIKDIGGAFGSIFGGSGGGLAGIFGGGGKPGGGIAGGLGGAAGGFGGFLGGLAGGIGGALGGAALSAVGADRKEGTLNQIERNTAQISIGVWQPWGIVDNTGWCREYLKYLNDSLDTVKGHTDGIQYINASLDTMKQALWDILAKLGAGISAVAAPLAVGPAMDLSLPEVTAPAIDPALLGRIRGGGVLSGPRPGATAPTGPAPAAAELDALINQERDLMEQLARSEDAIRGATANLPRPEGTRNGQTVSWAANPFDQRSGMDKLIAMMSESERAAAQDAERLANEQAQIRERLTRQLDGVRVQIAEAQAGKEKLESIKSSGLQTVSKLTEAAGELVEMNTAMGGLVTISRENFAQSIEIFEAMRTSFDAGLAYAAESIVGSIHQLGEYLSSTLDYVAQAIQMHLEAITARLDYQIEMAAAGPANITINNTFQGAGPDVADKISNQIIRSLKSKGAIR